MHSSESTTDTFLVGLSDLYSIKIEKRHRAALAFMLKQGEKKTHLQKGTKTAFHLIVSSLYKA